MKLSFKLVELFPAWFGAPEALSAEEAYIGQVVAECRDAFSQEIPFDVLGNRVTASLKDDPNATLTYLRMDAPLTQNSFSLLLQEYLSKLPDEKLSVLREHLSNYFEINIPLEKQCDRAEIKKIVLDKMKQPLSLFPMEILDSFINDSLLNMRLQRYLTQKGIRGELLVVNFPNEKTPSYSLETCIRLSSLDGAPLLSKSLPFAIIQDEPETQDAVIA